MDLWRDFSNAAPIIGTAVGGFFGGPLGASAGAGIGGMLAQQQGQKDANTANEQQVQQQQQFQADQTGTAHQREVNDLKLAGLNPILSVNAGANSATGGAAQIKNANEGMSASAVDIAKMMQELKASQASIDLTKAQTDKTRVDAQVAKRGIPAADMTNEAYGYARSIGKKISSQYKDFFDGNQWSERPDRSGDRYDNSWNQTKKLPFKQPNLQWRKK